MTDADGVKNPHHETFRVIAEMEIGWNKCRIWHQSKQILLCDMENVYRKMKKLIAIMSSHLYTYLAN